MTPYRGGVLFTPVPFLVDMHAGSRSLHLLEIMLRMETLHIIDIRMHFSNLFRMRELYHIHWTYLSTHIFQHLVVLLDRSIEKSLRKSNSLSVDHYDISRMGNNLYFSVKTLLHWLISVLSNYGDALCNDDCPCRRHSFWYFLTPTPSPISYFIQQKCSFSLLRLAGNLSISNCLAVFFLSEPRSHKHQIR